MKISKPQHLNTSIYYNKYKKMEKQTQLTNEEETQEFKKQVRKFAEGLDCMVCIA